MSVRKLVALAMILVLAPGSGSFLVHADAAAPDRPSIELVPVLANLSSPVLVTNAHDGSNRLFVVEQDGVIKVLQPGGITPTIFLDISSRVLSGGERGLLGLTFHPQFSSNRRFFVDYTRQPEGATVIAEYQASQADPNVAEPAETVLLVIPQPFPNHNGGMVEFGPDGFLYIAMGDGGSANDPGNRGQNVNELLGKMLRIDVDHPNPPQPYSSPPTNPFFGAIPGADEIYAYGLRNPWRFSFDRLTGDLYAGDVGQNAVEEIDIISLGGNYGWRIWEGTRCTNNDPALCQPNGFIFPITEYSHTAGRCAVVGGYVYRGAQSSLPVGSYVFGDLCTGEIFLLEHGTQSVALDSGLSISSFGEDEAGEIYVVNLGGTVQRIANASRCTFVLTATSRSVPAAGTRAGAVGVRAPAGCDWSADSADPWITVTAGSGGSGIGVVIFSVAPNPSASPRAGTLSIAGQTFTVSQAGASCVATISPKAEAFGPSGGSGSVSVMIPGGCDWTAASNVPWVTITSGGSGSGNGTVRYSVEANSGVLRTGTLTVAERTFTVLSL